MGKKREEWDRNQWDKVIFSDETLFTVRPTSLKKLSRFIWMQIMSQ